MCVFNEEMYLDASINSVLKNTFRQFELIIVDDASTDNSPNIINKWALRDNRIVFCQNLKNLGTAASSTIAFSICTGELIAIMDADDISIETRFEKEVSFLAKNPKIDLIGSSMFLLRNDVIYSTLHAKTENLESLLLKENIFYNPTIMFRSKLLHSGFFKYNFKFKHTFDYELWTRLAYNFKFANIEEPLVAYRADKNSKNSMSSKSPFRREIEVLILRTRYLVSILISKQIKLTHIRFFFASIIKGSLPAFFRIFKFWYTRCTKAIFEMKFQ